MNIAIIIRKHQEVCGNITEMIQTEKTPAAGNTKDVGIAVPLKYLSNFWRTLESSLIICEINLIITWSKDWVISSAAGATKFKITDTKIYVPVVTLSTQDNAKLLQQLKSSLKRTLIGTNINQKFHQRRQNQYLDFLIDPSFQRLNILFILLFENEENGKVHKGYYLQK